MTAIYSEHNFIQLLVSIEILSELSEKLFESIVNKKLKL